MQRRRNLLEIRSLRLVCFLLLNLLAVGVQRPSLTPPAPFSPSHFLLPPSSFRLPNDRFTSAATWGRDLARFVHRALRHVDRPPTGELFLARPDLCLGSVKEAGMWLVAVVLFLLIRVGEGLPLSSIGLGTARPSIGTHGANRSCGDSFSASSVSWSRLVWWC